MVAVVVVASGCSTMSTRKEQPTKPLWIDDNRPKNYRYADYPSSKEGIYRHCPHHHLHHPMPN